MKLLNLVKVKILAAVLVATIFAAPAFAAAPLQTARTLIEVVFADGNGTPSSLIVEKVAVGSPVVILESVNNDYYRVSSVNPPRTFLIEKRDVKLITKGE